MIICSKHEGNGTYREFVLDDREMGEKVPVKTHLARRAGSVTVTNDDDWCDAGVITRARDGLEASVLLPARRGARSSDFVKLDRLFPNEIAALQAIAVTYVAGPVLTN